MIDPNLTLCWSEPKYLSNEESISLATNDGLRGHIKLKEHAAILLISKSQCLSFWKHKCYTNGLKYGS